jgi:hypothetical protein
MAAAVALKSMSAASFHLLFAEVLRWCKAVHTDEVRREREREVFLGCSVRAADGGAVPPVQRQRLDFLNRVGQGVGAALFEM